VFLDVPAKSGKRVRYAVAEIEKGGVRRPSDPVS